MPIDDSDSRLLARVKSAAAARAAAEAPAPAVAPATKTANVTASAPAPTTYSAGNWRRAEEKSNEEYYKSLPKKEETKSVTTSKVNNQTTQTPNPVVAPTPATPAPAITPTVNQSVTQSIKTATPDIILFDDDMLPVNLMLDLVFEDIGGQELINIGRNDIINGQNVIYQPIKNLNLIQQQYNPNNIIGIQETSDKYFAGFSIKFESKIPDIGNGTNGENVYMDSATGSIIIELVNMSPDDQVEVQMITSGTIYEVIL
jgi:hypothetical protein